MSLIQVHQRSVTRFVPASQPAASRRWAHWNIDESELIEMWGMGRVPAILHDRALAAVQELKRREGVGRCHAMKMKALIYLTHQPMLCREKGNMRQRVLQATTSSCAGGTTAPSSVIRRLCW